MNESFSDISWYIDQWQVAVVDSNILREVIFTIEENCNIL